MTNNYIEKIKSLFEHISSIRNVLTRRVNEGKMPTRDLHVMYNVEMDWCDWLMLELHKRFPDELDDPGKRERVELDDFKAHCAIVDDKKTDLDRFLELYRSFGIECKVNIVTEAHPTHQFRDIEIGDRRIYLSADGFIDEQRTYSRTFDGWGDFHSDIIFDSNGTFKRQGFWE